MRECCESRKNSIYDIWRKPKYLIMDNQQPRPEQGKAQRLSKTIINITLDKENKMCYNIKKERKIEKRFLYYQKINSFAESKQE